MGYWILNESLSVILVLSWLGVNFYLFIDTFCWYEKEESFFYTRVILGSTLAWARASAICLNFNCMLILLPISRNLISFIRGASICCRGPWRRQLDKNLKFHKLVAYGIVVNATIHVAAHVCNLERYGRAQSAGAQGLVAALSQLGGAAGETYLNPVRTFQANTTTELLMTVAGITGLMISLALTLIVTSSTEFIRQISYELFWYTHHVFIIFFISLAVHGTGRIVRGQTPESLLLHNVTICRDHYAEWRAAAQCPVPQFSGKEPSTWKWVLGPVVLYACERIIRVWRFQQEVVITKVVSHPSGVLELRMKKRHFKMAPGQYILVQCPSISSLEWHPFTLTSAPQEDSFSVHIRAAGDWTAALCQAFDAEGQALKEPWNLPRLAVDGPFGAALTDVFHYPVSVCIAAGIGVTPFAAVLKCLWYRCCEAQPPLALSKSVWAAVTEYHHRGLTDNSLGAGKSGINALAHLVPAESLVPRAVFQLELPLSMADKDKVYFYWICRDSRAFEWFADLLLSLETRMSEQGKTHLLSYHIFLTGWDENQAIHIALHWDENTDVITGLKQKTFYGRPNWNNEFRQIAYNHPSSSIGVFFCGPKDLSKTLQRMCRLYSSADPRGVHFYYNKESF